MNPELPATFVQIHYHDRLGGVRQAMVEYSRAFSRLAGASAPNYWWCGQSGQWRYSVAAGLNLSGADYHTYTSAKTFMAAADRLTATLLRQLQNLAGTGPVAVVGHNLGLGKNPALSEAFARCARFLDGKGCRFRFFSVLHDVAEQGRFDLLGRLEQLRAGGADVYASLYAKGAPVHFIAPDRRIREITHLPEDQLTILPHPVEKVAKPLPVATSIEVRRLLGELARRDRLFFNEKLPVYAYPSRMIYRKNVLEALMLAAVMHNSSLVTGPSGTSAADRRRMEAARKLASAYRLSLAVDPSRINRFTRQSPETGEQHNPFTSLYGVVEGILSTSVTEGFGYTFYEPWLYGATVTGRRPDGIILPPEMDTISLYTRVPIPCSWVPIDRCYDRYVSTVNCFAAGRHVTKQRFLKSFIVDETVDFGRLDTMIQMSVIKRVMHSDTSREELALLFKRYDIPFGTHAQQPLSDSTTRRIVDHLTAWSSRGFGVAFEKCFSRIPRRPVPATWYRRLGAWYGRTENIRITAPKAGY